MPSMDMQQSSGSIGSLAAALARSQVELINPEKSMVATIRPEGRGTAEQIFRYMPPCRMGSTLSKTWRARNAWGRRSLMRGAMLYLRSSA
jgi:hypothetical protein